MLRPSTRTIFCADARPEAGLGHVQRCIAAAAAFGESGVPGSVEVVALGGGVAERNRIPGGVELRQVGLEEVQRAPELVLNGAPPAGVMLVVDCYPPVAGAWLGRFRRRFGTVPVLLFDDGEEDPAVPVLGALRVTLGATRARLDVERGCFDAAGTEYIPIRPALRGLARPAPMGAGRPTVVIALGGADPDDGAERLAAAVAGIAEPARFVVVHGPFTDPDRLKWRPPDERFTLLRDPPDFPEVLASADLGITGLGQTCHELLFLGVPVAAVAVTPQQAGAGLALERSRGGIYLGELAGLDMGAVVGRVRECLADRAAARAMAAHAQALVDGRGGARLAGHIAAVAGAYFTDAFDPQLIAAEFDDSGANAQEEHAMVRWGSDASMLNRIRLARDLIDWRSVSSWLDVGSGTGRFLAEVEEVAEIDSFAGVDLSAVMVRNAGTRPFRTSARRFVQQSFAAPVPGEPFSLVTALGVLQKCGLSLEFSIARLGELARAGGQVFLTTKNAAWERFADPECVRCDWHHWFEPERLVRACRWANLEVTTIGSFDPASAQSSSDLARHHSVFLLARRRPW